MALSHLEVTSFVIGGFTLGVSLAWKDVFQGAITKCIVHAHCHDHAANHDGTDYKKCIILKQDSLNVKFSIAAIMTITLIILSYSMSHIR